MPDTKMSKNCRSLYERTMLSAKQLFENIYSQADMVEFMQCLIKLSKSMMCLAAHNAKEETQEEMLNQFINIVKSDVALLNELDKTGSLKSSAQEKCEDPTCTAHATVH